MHLIFDLGVGYTYEALVNETSDYFGIFFSFSYKHDITEYFQIRIDASFNIDLKNFERWLLIAECEITFALSTDFSIGVRLEDTFKGRPAAGFKPNDIRLMVTLSFIFKSSDYFKHY